MKSKGTQRTEGDVPQPVLHKLDRLVSELRAERESQAETRRTDISIQHSIKRSQWVIALAALLSFGVAILYTIASFSQLRALKSANETTDRSVAVAIESQKPWLLLAGIETIAPPALNKTAKMKVHWQNYGATPALRVRVNICTWIPPVNEQITAKFVEANLRELKPKTSSVAVVGPRSVPDVTTEISSGVFEPRLWDDFQAGRRRLVAFGEAVYTDAFTDTDLVLVPYTAFDFPVPPYYHRRTSFCQYYDVTSGAWTWCEHFNSVE